MEQRFLKVQEIRKRKNSMISDHVSERDTVHKLSAVKKEESVEVTCKSYVEYIFFSKINYFLFPLSVLFLFGC